MSRSTTLPPALAPWAVALSTLEPHLAQAIGPLVRQLDHLLSARDLSDAADGPLDGYEGLVRRGDPSHLVMSEWAMAEAVPEEFIRRAAASELLYLSPAHRVPRARGRTAVLVDPGPDQLGTGRLVQLAALVVLQRRAEARGVELVLGLLGEPAGAWRIGGFAGLLSSWVRGRTGGLADPADVEVWQDSVAAVDDVWLLCGPRLAAALPGRPRTLVSRPCAWTAAAAAAVEVTLEGDRVELTLPPSEVSVRALRGGVVRAPEPSPADRTLGGLADLRFPSGASRLLARGSTPAELVVVPVPPDGRVAKAPFVVRFGHPVVAASFVGRRVVALVADGDALRVATVGRPLRRLTGATVPLHAFGLDRPALDQLLTSGLGQLYHWTGDLLAEVAGVWWLLRPVSDPTSAGQEGPVIRASRWNGMAVAPGEAADRPRIGFRLSDQVYLPQSGGLTGVAGDSTVLFGPGQRWAWSVDGRTWGLRPGQSVITLEPGAAAVAVVAGRGESSGAADPLSRRSSAARRQRRRRADPDLLVRRDRPTSSASATSADRGPPQSGAGGDRSPQREPESGPGVHVSGLVAGAFRGSVLATAFVLDPDLVGPAEARRRTLALWSDGADLRALPDGRWLLVLERALEVRAELAPGLPLVGSVTAGLSMPGVPGHPGALSLVNDGALLQLAVAGLEPVPVHGWVDLSGFVVQPLTVDGSAGADRGAARPARAARAGPARARGSGAGSGSRGRGGAEPRPTRPRPRRTASGWRPPGRGFGWARSWRPSVCWSSWSSAWPSFSGTPVAASRGLSRVPPPTRVSRLPPARAVPRIRALVRGASGAGRVGRSGRSVCRWSCRTLPARRSRSSCSPGRAPSSSSASFADCRRDPREGRAVAAPVPVNARLRRSGFARLGPSPGWCCAPRRPGWCPGGRSATCDS